MKKKFSVIVLSFLSSCLILLSGCIFSGDSDEKNREDIDLLMKFEVTGGIAGDHITYSVYKLGYKIECNRRKNDSITTPVTGEQLKEVAKLLNTEQFYSLKAEYKSICVWMDGFNCTFLYYGPAGTKQIIYEAGSDLPEHMKTTMRKVCSIIDIPPYELW